LETKTFYQGNTCIEAQRIYAVDPNKPPVYVKVGYDWLYKYKNGRYVLQKNLPEQEISVHDMIKHVRDTAFYQPLDMIGFKV
jgi:hypothetical protein